MGLGVSGAAGLGVPGHTQSTGMFPGELAGACGAQNLPSARDPDKRDHETTAGWSEHQITQSLSQ